MSEPINSQQERLVAVVSGRVQGVGFRYYVQQAAVLLKLVGWVRNRWDGCVEVVAEGSHNNLLQLLRVLYQGPSSAVVEDVDADWQPASGEYSSFRVKG